jgi:hypothetical protein
MDDHLGQLNKNKCPEFHHFFQLSLCMITIFFILMPNFVLLIQASLNNFY